MKGRVKVLLLRFRTTESKTKYRILVESFKKINNTNNARLLLGEKDDK